MYGHIRIFIDAYIMMLKKYYNPPLSNHSKLSLCQKYQFDEKNYWVFNA